MSGSMYLPYYNASCGHEDFPNIYILGEVMGGWHINRSHTTIKKIILNGSNDTNDIILSWFS